MAVVAVVALRAVGAGAGAPPGEVVRVEHRDPRALPSRGPTTAPVTIELFFTPGPQSRVAAYKLVEKLAAEHPTKIRLVYRILGGSGTAQLHYAALEAYAEGRFFEFMDALNAKRETLTTPKIIDLGRELGIDPERLASAMRDPPPAYKRLIDGNDRRRKQRIIGGGAQTAALFNGRLPQHPLSALGAADLEREYQGAKELAEDLIDRGAAPTALADASAPAPSPQDIVVAPGPTDEELDASSGDGGLASPPLGLAGWPSFGPAAATVTITVLCSPTSPNCLAPMRAARITQDLYPDTVRVVWAPYYDVTRDDAAELGLLADAALCADQVGTSSEADFGSPSSPGWHWVEAMLAEATSPRHRQLATEALLDKVGDRLHVDRRAFAKCRAELAGASLAWIEAARHAGVRVTPSTVVGGRIYGPIIDANTLQLLVEAELAPSDCPGCLHLADYAPTWRRRL